jgi:hypothetical protein
MRLHRSAVARLAGAEAAVIRRLPERTPLQVITMQEVAQAFPRATAAQREVLALTVTIGVLEWIDDERAERVSEAIEGQQEQLRIRMLMDKRTQAESTLSNLMRRFGETAEQIICNLK